jgi:dTDP-4-amino-4,6-dideoxygalactose transaminase
MTWRVALADLDFDEAETRAVLDVLERKWLTMGPMTERFEAAFASAVGAAHAVAVSNGTAALHLACVALGIGPGDEVIVPSLTFVATANAVVYCGATPVFADIASEDDWTISADDVERRITDSTAAVVVMHYGGHPCEMGAILDVARRHGLAVIEDCAHAPLAALDGRCVGTFGAAGCFSFYANKNLAVGEGGMVVTDDAELAEQVRRLRCHGMSSACIERHVGAGPLYDVTDLGYNYRLDEIRAAIGLAQLGKLRRGNARRRELMARYRESIAAVDGARMPFAQTRGEPACHICPVLLDEEVDRAECIGALRDRGIQTSVHYTPAHRFRYYREHWGGEACVLPHTEMVGARELTLPLHTLMTEHDVDAVVAALGEAAGDRRPPASAGAPMRGGAIVT